MGSSSGVGLKLAIFLSKVEKREILQSEFANIFARFFCFVDITETPSMGENRLYQKKAFIHSFQHLQ